MAAPFDLNLRHLRALVARSSQHGSMSAAAAAVSLSQPALTQGLAKLEAPARHRAVRATARRHGAHCGRHDHGRTRRPPRSRISQRRRAAPRGGRGFARPEQLMTATQLRAFLALADAGSFVAAAAATGLSQPALHRAVRDLEQVCGAALVERRGRGVALTAAGRRLARGIRLAARRDSPRASPRSTAMRRRRAASSIGAMPLSRALLLPARDRRLLARGSPGVEIVDRRGLAGANWSSRCATASIDLMIGALRDAGAARSRPAAAVRRSASVIVARAGHPLAGGRDADAGRSSQRYPLDRRPAPARRCARSGTRCSPDGHRRPRRSNADR